MHSRRTGASSSAAATSSSQHRHQHHHTRSFDEKDEELYKKRGVVKARQRRKVVKITVTPSRLMELFLIVLLGWFVYDNYRNDKTKRSTSLLRDEGEKTTILSKVQTLFGFFRKEDDDETTTTTTTTTTSASEKQQARRSKGAKVFVSSEKEDEEEDPLAKLDMSLIERQKVHDADGVGKKEDDFDADTSEGTLGSGAEVETHREGNVASPRASSKRPCKGIFSALEFGECSVKCGIEGGIKLPLFEKDDNMDEDCVLPKPPVSSSMKCNVGVECPQNCIGKFDEWTACDEECGVGFRRRQFIVTQPQKGTGSKCAYVNGHVATEKCFGDKTGTTFCQNRDCAGDFGAWSKCTKECGGGTKHRVYSQTQKAGTFGKSCPYPDKYREQEKCNEEECILPDFCEGRWKITEPCSAKCGGGKTTRAFFVTKEGKECPNEDVREVLSCNTQSCPKARDCGKWEPWSACSVPCDDGIQTRRYKRTGPAVFGGKCPEEDGAKQKRKCNLGSCENLCMGAFTDWDVECPKCISEGSYTADNKFRTRKYVIPDSDAENSSSYAKCPHENGYVERQKCPPLMNTCPVRCIGEWSAFSKCTRDCDGGTTKKTYSIFRPAKGSGEQCEAKHGQVVENECNTHKCERECLGVWNKHTGCIVSAKNFADPDLKCTGEKIERFDLIPPQIEKHIGCSLPTVGGDIFDTYEGEKGWFKRVLCDTGKCIKKVEIEIVSDDGGNSYDDDDNDADNEENTRVSKVRRSKRRGGSSGSMK